MYITTSDALARCFTRSSVIMVFNIKHIMAIARHDELKKSNIYQARLSLTSNVVMLCDMFRSNFSNYGTLLAKKVVTSRDDVSFL